MSEQDTAHLIRRILVALDASPHSLAALDAAVALARRLEAELLGLFVEDAQLLEMAESPYAREILYPSARESPLSRAGMEQKLRVQSEQARAALASAAGRAQIPYSFRCLRGQVASELLSVAAEGDLLAVGKIGWSLGARLRLGSTARELATGPIPVLLLSEKGFPAQPHFFVCYDNSSESRRALLSSARMAQANSRKLTVILQPDVPEAEQASKENINRLLRDSGVEVRYLRIDSSNATALLEALRSVNDAVLVIGGPEPFRKLPCLDTILRDSETAVLLFRDGG
jgi:nucleotide-binding universal stress UspA family protein